MKSAIELAMERAGDGGKKLTDAQKKKIEKIRARARADAAQERIMFDQKAASLQEGPERDKAEAEYRRVVEKTEEKAEREVQKVRDNG